MKSCIECKNVGARRPEADVNDSISTFKAYWCKCFKTVIHDYYADCKGFEPKEVSVCKENTGEKKIE
jgi:hypothetical protein